MLPETTSRVEEHTAPEINERNRLAAEQALERYASADQATIGKRIEELDQEWDIERALEANAATAALIGLGLGATVNRRWFLLPTVVAGFLLQHALQGWCPPLPVLRRLGFRTSAEIEQERSGLRAMRGDFDRYLEQHAPGEYGTERFDESPLL